MSNKHHNELVTTDDMEHLLQWLEEIAHDQQVSLPHIIQLHHSLQLERLVNCYINDRKLITEQIDRMCESMDRIAVNLLSSYQGN